MSWPWFFSAEHACKEELADAHFLKKKEMGEFSSNDYYTVKESVVSSGCTFWLKPKKKPRQTYVALNF